MNYRNNKVSVILLLGSLLLSGCGLSSSSDQEYNETNHGEITAQVEESVEDTAIDYYMDEKQSTEGNRTDDDLEQVEPPITDEVHIYTISNDTIETKATVANVPEDTEITASLIAQLVISDIADKSFVIEVEDVTLEADCVVVDFNCETPPVVNVGIDTETAILDAFAFSMIDNIENCNGVIFRAGGNAYSSENYSFGLDEVYLSR